MPSVGCMDNAHLRDLRSPSKRSFSRSVLDAFTEGLRQAGHSYEIADLYEMDFQSEMDEAQYFRETSGDPNLPVPRDVEEEQARSIGLVAWPSSIPCGGVTVRETQGWFDRVLTCGYAYVYDAKGARGTR